MNKNSNRLVSITIHILIWTGLIAIPQLVGYLTHLSPLAFDPKSLIMPVQIMALFYLNYLFLINRLLFNKRVWQFIGLNLLIVIAVSVSVLYLLHTFFPGGPNHPHPDMERIRGMLQIAMNMIMQTLVIGLSVAIKMTNKWYEENRRVQELEKSNTQAELQQLKSQLNPHFLFNSLNNIYALIAFNPEKAQLSLSSLCDMLRYQLYEANRETIPLEKEIEFVHSYCELMRLRLPKEVLLKVDLPTATGGIMIAPLLFVSIVENAFKHGVSQQNPSHISIRITVSEKQIVCFSRNSYYPKRDNDRSGSGIGIENLLRRLELLYPDAHSFKAEKIGQEYVALLTINTTPYD